MRFLRMLTNSLLAGALGAAYLTVLVLQLNPHVPIASDTTWRWFATLGIFYGVHLAALFYLLMMAREFFSLDSLSPGWASVRVLAWLAAALAASAATLMWLNVRGFEAVLGETAARRMTAGAAATSAAAVMLLGIAIAHYSFGRRGSRVGAALFVIAAFGSLALPLAARGPAVAGPPMPASSPADVSADEESNRRVVMLLLDGASLEYIWPQAAAGRLPNFARLLDTGAMLNLATVRPTGPGPIWASVATGLYPDRTGIRSGQHYTAWRAREPVDLLPDHSFSHALVHLGAVRQAPTSSEAWRAHPVWSILSDAGIRVGVVRWPLTYPAPPVDGFVVSDRYHELLGSVMELDESVAYPSAVLPLVRSAFLAPAEESLVPVVPAVAGGRDETPEVNAARPDAAYSRTMRELRQRIDARFVALRYQGLDTIGHYYMGDTQPGVVGDPNDHDRRRHVQVLERYYMYIDAEVGAALAALAPEDLLLVVSGFGMQRQNSLKQIAGRLLGDPDMTGTHDRAPDGFLLAYGAAVQSSRLQRGSIVDVTPTVLYYFGLPVGRDMDGYARTDIFTREFTAERPIAFIPSYSR
jgi:predicted AlkP superfamily phosphohydrolase/phosphomutase